jgi:hypothetical protein
MPLHQGKPRGALYSAGQRWQIHEIREHWLHPGPVTAGRGVEIQRWRLLVEGPPVYGAGEDGFREVIVSAFAEDDAWWLDVS